MKIGLFFGSFNPVHTGHLIIANYMADYAGLDKIWFVVSPQNPFKTEVDLLPEQQRLDLLNLAISGDDRLISCDVEFILPRPSYTVDTLACLREQFPSHVFTLIIGGDNFQSFHRWKNYQEILAYHEVFVYARTGIVEAGMTTMHKGIRHFEVPLLNISSTYIRETIKAGKSVRYLVPDVVRERILKERWYH